MSLARPALTPDLPPASFRNFYWLKEELTAFCQQNGLSTAGSKMEISARIEHFLTTGTAPVAETVPGRRVSVGKLPEALRRETVIGPGWRCSEPLRAFFVHEIGPQFHFNGVMRDFIKDGAGKTLQDAIDAWQNDRNAPQAETEIALQFEYNRHIREFHKTHPGSTRQDAIAAWKNKRAQPKQRGDVENDR